ncbi:MAG: PucR family transcriptional regulator [Actinoallomurus sp.]
MATSGRRRNERGKPAPSREHWLGAVAQAAAAKAEAPAELLGEYLTLLADAAVTGRRPDERELAAVRQLGRQAAEQSIGAERVVDLYLAAAWRLWRTIPAEVRTRNRDAVSTAAEAVLRVVDAAVAVLVEGHQAERRYMIRREESLRREMIDDLLRGDADVARLVERAEPFGLDLTLAHAVVLAAPGSRIADAETAAPPLERAVVDRFGDRDVLVATKDTLLVVLVPAPAAMDARSDDVDVAEFVHQALRRSRRGGPWRVAAGRSYPGAYGVARSYEEAREALALAERLRLARMVVNARDLLVYRVVARDQAAVVDLVQTVLTPLIQARGGAEPLLETLDAYFTTGEIATEAARRLHVSVRTVTYRLAKIAALTGYDPGDPAQRFALHVAVLGARLLQWPEHDLPIRG